MPSRTRRRAPRPPRTVAHPNAALWGLWALLAAGSPAGMVAVALALLYWWVG